MATLTFSSAVSSDLAEIRNLLESVSLPAEDVREHLPHFILVRVDQELIACIGLELHGSIGLLRSLAVHPDHRSRGIARQLCDRVISHASDQGVKDMYLITDTAEGYFSRLGWSRIDRTDAPAEIRNTQQFRVLCPSSAVCMRK